MRKKTRGQQCASRAIGPAKETILPKLGLYVPIILGHLFPKDGFKMVSDLIDALSQINAYFLIIALFSVKFVSDALLQ